MGNIISNSDGELVYDANNPDKNLLTKYIYDWSLNNYTITDDPKDINLNTDVLKKRACCIYNSGGSVYIDFPVLNTNWKLTTNNTLSDGSTIKHTTDYTRIGEIYKNKVILQTTDPVKNLSPLNSISDNNNVINTLSLNIPVFPDRPTPALCSNLKTDNGKGIFNMDKVKGANNNCMNFYPKFCNEIKNIRNLNIIPKDNTTRYNVQIYGPNINLDGVAEKPDLSGNYKNSYADCDCQNSIFMLEPDKFAIYDKVTGQKTEGINNVRASQIQDSLCMTSRDTLNYAYISNWVEGQAMCINYVDLHDTTIKDNSNLKINQGCNIKTENATISENTTHTIPTTPAPTTPAPTIPPKYNRNNFVVWTNTGTDLPGMPINGTENECETQCDNNPLCLGFSWASDTNTSVKSNCWLKQNIDKKDLWQTSYVTYVKPVPTTPVPTTPVQSVNPIQPITLAPKQQLSLATPSPATPVPKQQVSSTPIQSVNPIQPITLAPKQQSSLETPSPATPVPKQQVSSTPAPSSVSGVSLIIIILIIVILFCIGGFFLYEYMNKDTNYDNYDNYYY
jgi:hypothetical protein